MSHEEKKKDDKSVILIGREEGKAGCLHPTSKTGVEWVITLYNKNKREICFRLCAPLCLLMYLSREYFILPHLKSLGWFLQKDTKII